MSEPSTIRQYLRARGGMPGYQAATVADLGRRVLRGEAFWFALREFLDGVGYTVEVVGPQAVGALIGDRPPRLADDRQWAFLAALAEHLACRHRLPSPAWAGSPEAFLAQWWFAVPAAAFEALALRDSPAAFRRRGIFIGPSLLSRC